MAQCTGNPCLLLTALLLAVFLVEALTYIFFGPRVSFMVSFPCVVLAFLCSAVCCGCKPREPSNSHAVQQQHRYSQTVAPSAAPAAAVEALALPAAGAAAAFARSGSEVVCAICLGVLLAGEMVRQLPACKHMFHDECVAAWLQSHSTCPLCRAEAAPKAAAGKEKAGDGEAASSPRPRPRPPV